MPPKRTIPAGPCRAPKLAAGPDSLNFIGKRWSSGHVRVGQVIENHRAASAEQLALAGKQGVFNGPVVFDQDIAETIELVQFEPLSGIEAQELERGAVGLQPVQGGSDSHAYNVVLINFFQNSVMCDSLVVIRELLKRDRNYQIFFMKILWQRFFRGIRESFLPRM